MSLQQFSTLQCFFFLLSLFYVCTADVTTTDICMTRKPSISHLVNSLSSYLSDVIEGDKNYIFSPLSISVALGMVYMGTRGETRDQMIEALNYTVLGRNCLNTKISEHFENLISSLENDGNGYTFLVANGVFIQLGFKVSHFYAYNVQKYFKSDMLYLNFAEEEQQSMEKINQWASNATRGKIVKLLNEPLDPLTVMILMNAVYFKGLWEHQFEESATWNTHFYRQNGTSKLVPFMRMQEQVNYYHDDQRNYSYLELNYKGKSISMMLILPSRGDFPRISLTTENLCKIRQKLRLEQVMVVIPKFKLEYRRELSKDMIKLGMTELFSDKADLTGIRDQNELHVSLMIHQAVIDVNEQGSEAAGLSGIGIDGRQKFEEQTVFWANHPFLFYIIDKRTDTILFAGRVTDP